MNRFLFLTIIKMALKSLRRHKVRSGLALLGIVIGIASLIVTFSVGSGARESVKEQFLALGQNTITVHPGNYIPEERMKKVNKKDPLFTYEDYTFIKQTIPGLIACSPSIESKRTLKYNGKEYTCLLKGVTEDFLNLSSHKIAHGSFFNPLHMTQNAQVVILSHNTAKELFGKHNPINETIIIQQKPFKIIGVLKEQKSAKAFWKESLEIFAPFHTVWKKVIPHTNRNIDLIVMRTEDSNQAKAVADLRRAMRFRRNIQENQLEDFTIWDLKAVSEAAQKASEKMGIFLIIAAGASLLVGGIGIMNIMLVSMIERKKEIGLRMAVGATPGNILLQFLSESVLLCLVGGIVGIAAGIGISILVADLTSLKTVLELQPVIIALATTCSIGGFFGFYPAYKASKLDPIEALDSG